MSKPPSLLVLGIIGYINMYVCIDSIFDVVLIALNLYPIASAYIDLFTDDVLYVCCEACLGYLRAPHLTCHV